MTRMTVIKGRRSYDLLCLSTEVTKGGRDNGGSDTGVRKWRRISSIRRICGVRRSIAIWVGGIWIGSIVWVPIAAVAKR